MAAATTIAPITAHIDLSIWSDSFTQSSRRLAFTRRPTTVRLARGSNAFASCRQRSKDVFVSEWNRCYGQLSGALRKIVRMVSVLTGRGGRPRQTASPGALRQRYLIGSACSMRAAGYIRVRSVLEFGKGSGAPLYCGWERMLTTRLRESCFISMTFERCFLRTARAAHWPSSRLSRACPEFAALVPLGASTGRSYTPR